MENEYTNSKVALKKRNQKVVNSNEQQQLSSHDQLNPLHSDDVSRRVLSSDRNTEKLFLRPQCRINEREYGPGVLGTAYGVFRKL